MDMKPDNIVLQKLIVHFVGNKNNLGGVQLSDEAVELDDEMAKTLQESFLARFRNNHEPYSFHHAESLQFNEVFQYTSKAFKDGEFFEEAAAAIAKHLYEQSNHPKIREGDLYLAYFNAIPVEGRMHKAIGIFKTEHKSVFLEVEQKKRKRNVLMKEGVEINRMDKGCLVIDNKEKEGLDVLIFDNQNRGDEAAYWKENFLSVIPQQNDFHHTSHILTLTRQFITGQLKTELDVDPTVQADLLHKSLDYFKTNEAFNIEEFQKEVFEKEEVIDSFRRFGSSYIEKNDYEIAASFDISTDAVKKQGRVYKTVLKLDRNFHIYVHGRTDLIEKGVDMDGRKYYKIYYQEES
jgi:hypothetical protein